METSSNETESRESCQESSNQDTLASHKQIQ